MSTAGQARQAEQAGQGGHTTLHGVSVRRGDEASVGVQEAPPMSLYLHLPWCLRKCPYCDFNSHTLPHGEALPEDRYVAAVHADIERALPQVWGRTVHSVFIGGGTPSLFSPEAIDSLLTGVRTLLPVAPGAEVTLEANPGTFEAARFRAYAQAGVTRLSIGAQSFSDDALARIGRVHDAYQARRAIETAADAFHTWNLDLMYALPGQTPEALRADLREALSFDPPHLSYYHLTLEPNTHFALHPPPLPDEDAAADMQTLIEEETARAGLDRYEISAYARRGHHCEHNLNYWQFGDYLGVGAGAHGKLSFRDRIVRETRVRNPREYLRAMLDAAPQGTNGPIDASREVSAADLPFEFMLNALRLVGGVPAAMFVERTGLSPIAISGRVAKAVERGLLDPDPTVLRATPLGLRFLNDLQSMFLPDR